MLNFNKELEFLVNGVGVGGGIRISKLLLWGG